MSITEVIAAALVLAGCFVALTSALGILRMPDFYSRLHPAGKSDTLAQMLVMTGLMVQAGLSPVSFKLLLIVLFLLVTTPTSAHALSRAAYMDGRRPWKRGEEPR